MTEYTSVTNSSFLDAYGAGFASEAQQQEVDNPTTWDAFKAVVQTLFTPDLGTSSVLPAVEDASFYSTDDFSITVGLVLDRAHDVNRLLEKDWGGRQAELAGLGDAVWTKYGADGDTYNTVKAALVDGLGTGPIDAATAAGYLSSTGDRTIWLTLSAAQFNTLFARDLIVVGSPDSYDALIWAGNLSLPTAIAGSVQGIWIDQGFLMPNPYVIDSTEVPPVTLNGDGVLSLGNDAENDSETPSSVYAETYNFPRTHDAATPAVAVIEYDTPDPATLPGDYNAYRTRIGLDPVAADQFQIVGGVAGGAISQELALDISVVAGAAPQSTQVLYANANSVYQLYQNAFFETAGVDTPVVTSSWSWYVQPSADSPFQYAYQQLFVDGLLANSSVHIANGDLGSSGLASNGAANAISSTSPAWALAVGGTSLATVASAQTDSTLQSQLDSVMSSTPDLATLSGLVASGLKETPLHLSRHPPAGSKVVPAFETVWNGYAVSDFNQIGFGTNQAGAGGIDTELSRPPYQSDFGLTYDGRAAPDVSALAGGDAWYKVLNASYVNGDSESLFYPDGYGGTSAAAPLWAALTARFDAVFSDQGLPNLGFYNDLIYTAAAIAPASFNDITQGNNISSYYGTTSSTYYNDSDSGIAPTGQGYEAAPGYDLTTGLGSPNGVLLGRALTAIAHAQTSFADLPDMLVADDTGGWTSGTNQTLLLQGVASGGADVSVTAGDELVNFETGAMGTYAWTAQFAQQAMQEDFSRRLVRLFDRQSQGTVAEVTVQAGDSVAVSIESKDAVAHQGKLSSPFGFADFATDGEQAGTVRVALPVAVAETVGGRDDQTAIVRLRDNGRADLAVTFYRVDDLDGTIDGVAPGEVGYAALAQQRAYETGDGGTSIANPSKGNWSESTLLHVDAGDRVAMWLDNASRVHQFWAFAQANEVVAGQNVGHLWNYGLNTWGWEESYGGGDRDYNDLTVQLDFTSAYGQGYLAHG